MPEPTTPPPEKPKATAKQAKRLTRRYKTYPRRPRRARKPKRSRALKPLLGAALRSLSRTPTAEERRRIESYCDVAVQGAITFAQKHLVYGDACAENGPLGLAMELRTKVNRLLNMAGQRVATESKHDQPRDLHVYAGMLWMMLLGLWPGANADPRFAI